MSDYLTNIVERVLHPTQFIQPRLPSLFEPSSFSTGMLSGSPLPKTATAHEESSDASQRTQPSVRKFRESIAPAPLSALMPTHDSSRGRQDSSDVSVAEPGYAETVPANSLPVQTVGQPTTAISQTALESAPRSAPKTPVLVPLTAMLKIDTALPKDTESVDNSPARSTSTPAPQSATPTGVTMSAAQSILIKPVARAMTEQIIAEERSPTVKITIGRVDVRAMMPPQSPASRPAPSRPQPRLSLEDYLKQREEGQR